jgi:hypothetical protein
MNDSAEAVVTESSDDREAYTSPCIQKLGRIATIVEASSGSGTDGGIYAS